ncbi:MAG: protein kinase, partial [Chloroflexia bacterium]|nr:protein kinase [Chloroflexia bacterium]
MDPRPHPLTRLLGREREVAEAQQLLRHGEARLLTLSGPGGVGKTRLAIEIATTLDSEFSGGSRVVSLAGVDDPDQVAPVVAWALGVTAGSSRSAAGSLVEFLRDREMLVVLDNFEQVGAAAPLLADLLAAGPNLRLLVTSRSVLRLSGEHHLPIPPLAFPDPDRLPPLAALATMPAVRLFAERARAATGDFAVTAENAAAVATVCARLDGLP